MRNDFFMTLAAWSLLLMLSNIRVFAQTTGTHILPQATLAASHFGPDAPWYQANIPFFDCSDPEITAVYYYRWQLYKSHLKDLGARGYIVTEFLGDVSWAKRPFQSLIDAASFHIREGRWLRDSRYADDYINFMYSGGDDRHFSEWIAAAAYDDYLATGDSAFAVKNLAEMKRLYALWNDHYDAAQGLYFIEPISDATEYTISAVDASGGTDGFRGGQAFRPTINSFMYANALAISKLSSMTGDTADANDYAGRAAALKATLQSRLWNPDLQHFTDRYKASNANVHYGDFIRGRELAGYAPWFFDLPDNTPQYNAAWSHLLDPQQLGGPFGIRTVEPSYQYYMKQYRYDAPTGKRECQWNGPSWPFDTTFALGAMANLLHSYTPGVVTPDDYLRLLKQYAHQHYLNGALDLQEDYDPDTGKVIVGLDRSHHYNHSGFNDLIITGLAGLQPRADDTLEVNPIISRGPHALAYFCLENVPYHGQSVTILYDRDGKHYHRGAGMSVYVNGRQAIAPAAPRKTTAPIPPPPARTDTPRPIDLAVNMAAKGLPTPDASLNTAPADLFQAIDGRVWFWPNVRNHWTNTGSTTPTDWYSLDFGSAKTVHSLALYFYADGQKFQPPTACTVQSWTGTDWADIPNTQKTPASPLANGENTITFPAVSTSKLRLVFTNPKAASVALVELKAY